MNQIDNFFLNRKWPVIQTITPKHKVLVFLSALSNDTLRSKIELVVEKLLRS